MKQSELNKLLDKAIRESAKSNKWKSSYGYVFIKKGIFFFILIITANVKTKEIHYSLNYKLFEFDDIYWTILNMEENINRPVSLRATGAWAFPTQRINEGLIPLGTFDYDEILSATNQVIITLENVSNTLVDQVGNDIKKNLEYLESLYSSLKLKYPNSVINIHKEKVLTFILMREYETSLSICKERIANNDSGGLFGESFYEQAKEYLMKQESHI